MGHSSPGGFGSLIPAGRRPELLRSLVLLEPPALFDSHPAQFNAGVLQFICGQSV